MGNWKRWYISLVLNFSTAITTTTTTTTTTHTHTHTHTHTYLYICVCVQITRALVHLVLEILRPEIQQLSFT